MEGRRKISSKKEKRNFCSAEISFFGIYNPIIVKIGKISRLAPPQEPEFTLVNEDLCGKRNAEVLAIYRTRTAISTQNEAHPQ